MSWFSKKVMPFLTEMDEWGNAIVLAGSEEQTISAHTWQAEADGKLWGQIFRPVIDWLFGAGHCRRTFLAWLQATNGGGK